MKKCSSISVIVFIAATAFAPTALVGQEIKMSQSCLNSITGVVCPPPVGGITTDSINRIVCGPGECVKDNIGRVYCSSTPGGAVGKDNIGRVVCVGGCVEASAEYCIEPSE